MGRTPSGAGAWSPRRPRTWPSTPPAAPAWPCASPGPIVDAEYWEREVAHRLGPDATYLGHLDHSELAALVRTSRVSIMTPAWEEPFGLAAAEAIACGTPVAAFARGGLRRIVAAEAGSLAAPGDAEDLARAIRAAALLPRAGVRRHAEHHLALDTMGRRYERLYEGLRFGRRDATALPAS